MGKRLHSSISSGYCFSQRVLSAHRWPQARPFLEDQALIVCVKSIHGSRDERVESTVPSRKTHDLGNRIGRTDLGIKTFYSFLCFSLVKEYKNRVYFISSDELLLSQITNDFSCPFPSTLERISQCPQCIAPSASTPEDFVVFTSSHERLRVRNHRVPHWKSFLSLMQHVQLCDAFLEDLGTPCHHCKAWLFSLQSEGARIPPEINVSWQQQMDVWCK